MVTVRNFFDLPPRLIDWSILIVILLEGVTGIYSLTVGSPDEVFVFWLHSIGGVLLTILIGFKFYRVFPLLKYYNSIDREIYTSLIAVVLVVVALGSGILWTFGFTPWIFHWTLLTFHATIGALLLPVVFLHLISHIQYPSQKTLTDRRNAIKFVLMGIISAILWRLQGILNTLLSLPGKSHRFTGSKPFLEGNGNESFPITSWVADDPEPIDTETWELTVHDLSGDTHAFSYEQVATNERLRATLDCTSGWYTTQTWSGISVDSLLDQIDSSEKVTYVRFVSVTGYRWSLPIDEARSALLATHVGNERLSHGHGAPLRLVAPQRRGFQWVKWIDRIDLRQEPDLAQWIIIFISGFDNSG
ncbi:MAG: molybdopterin-dependent oxidoreductase [Halobacteriaceae archaeon]